ncbi:cytosine permease [Acidithrix sp. C25]|uniref:purine-cytosine permease family protein n=1 Tax=Acidithrix sp. C25 TaxID=1671482 RepID=UPI00191BAEF0|nr:cytosine permease [Acidithrix sp. C25]
MSLLSRVKTSLESQQLSKTTPNQRWKPETYGLGAIYDHDRISKPRDLIWIWMAANIGLVAVVYGAIMAAMALDPLQAIILAIIASIGSFIPVGLLSISGKRYGEPMLGLSVRVFGNKFNKGPAFASWLSLLGWETITAVIATEAIESFLGSHSSSHKNELSILILTAITIISLLASRLGHRAIVTIQKIIAWIFGSATVLLILEVGNKTALGVSNQAHPAPLTSVLASASIIAASGGISWLNASADYSRYLRRTEPSFKVTIYTALGAGIPFSILIIFGYLLAKSIPSLAGSENPIHALGVLLPTWMVGPYITLAIAGLIAQMILGLYSSGLSLLALGIRTKRTKTVFVDAAIVVALGAWIVTKPGPILTTLVSLVELLAVPISSWAVVFAIGIIAENGSMIQKSGFISRWNSFVSWITGTFAGLALTNSSVFSGPFGNGTIGKDNLGFVVGAMVALGLYVTVSTLDRHFKKDKEPLSVVALTNEARL